MPKHQVVRTMGRTVIEIADAMASRKSSECMH
jgi:hypothetical protein